MLVKNIPLLRKTRTFIKRHKKQWNQNTWLSTVVLDAEPECGTACCYAGWACLLGGWKRAYGARVYKEGTQYTLDKCIHVADAARIELGLDHVDAHLLFRASNDIEDIDYHVDRLVKEGKAEAKKK